MRARKLLIRVSVVSLLIKSMVVTAVLGALGIGLARSVDPGVVPGIGSGSLQILSATSTAAASPPATGPSPSATPAQPSRSAPSSGRPTPSGGSPAPGRPPAGARSAVLVGAGDIASCGSSGQVETAELLSGIAGTIFTAGDNSQDEGEEQQFADCFAPTWGRFKSRIRPVPGNHDYRTDGAAGYFGYFGEAAGTAGKGYYSYDLGNWHVVALNSNCDEIGGCEKGSAQETWLRADLAASSKPCTAAYWHHSMFTSSTEHDGATAVRPLYEALYEHGAEVLVSGHNHVYERFAPQNPDGRLDEAAGIQQFTVGTGGTGHYEFGDVRENSQVRNNDTYGVLKLTLEPHGYRWRFVPVEGKTFTDGGSRSCH